MNKEIVFVYGTLKEGCSNHYLLEHSSFINNAGLNGVMMVNLGHYPALLLKGNTLAQGEVYEVDEKTLRSLDRLEGHPIYYERKKVELTTGQWAWVYFLNVPEGKSNKYPEITSGIWLPNRKYER